MLIQNLSLKNFKCFEEVDVEFAPITLLTGANSSGKSSLIYSLLAVLQTEQFPFYLSPNGKYVNLGSFEEIVWKGVIKSYLNIALNLTEYEWIHIPGGTTTALGQNHIYNTVWKSQENNENPRLRYLTHQKPFAERIDTLKICIDYKSSDEFIINVETPFVLPTKLIEKLSRLKSFQLEESNYKFSIVEDKMKLSSTLKYIIEVAELDLFYSLSKSLDFDKNFNYIGSFRQPPERTYYQKAKAQSKVDIDGAGYIDQIIEWEETDSDKLEELAKIMSDLELFKEIKSNKFKGGRFELAVKTQTNSELAALTDVGFGISQFLPIIVADLQLSDNSCLALSQPEIHLHPKIQALFGNFLVNQISHTNKQYIVETHSEYLLNRLRLLLVKGELKPEEIRVYYFENDGIKTTTYNVEFTKDGQIKGAPDSFFDTYAVDVMDIALNA